MITIRRANVILDVEDSELERYLAEGFCLSDQYGHMIQPDVPNNLQFLQQAYKENLAKIAEQADEIQALKEQLAKKTRKK